MTEPLDVSLKAATAYAAEIGLDRFAIDGAQPGEYRVVRSIDQPSFGTTGRSVRSVVMPNGRPRINAPFRSFGHFVCTDPQNVHGIFWCLDLLKSGYVFVHMPTPQGPRKVSLIGQVARNCLSRVGWLTDRASRFHNIPTVRSSFRHRMRSRRPSYRSESGRILMITSHYALGGSERQMLVTAAGLIERGYDIRMLALYPVEPGTPNVEGEIAKLGITPHLCSDFPPKQAAGFRTPDGALAEEISGLPQWFANMIVPVGAAIRQYRPHVVHTWSEIAAVVGAFAACGLGVPRIVLRQRNTQDCMRRADAEVVDLLWEGYRSAFENPTIKIVSNSVAGAASYERWLGLQQGTIGVLYNAIPHERMRTPPPYEVSRFRANLGLSQVAPVVGTVMRFVEQKDPNLWLDTAAEIAKLRPDVRFLLAGYGELWDQMVRRIEALGLRDRVVLPGAVADAGLIYAAVDVLLLTSTVEGLPNVLIEAQAAGRPVVAPNVGGVSEAVKDGRTGRIVHDRLPQRLAEAVLDVLNDPAWAARAGAEGPAFVASRFAVDRMIAETLEIYDLPAYASG